VTLSLVGQERVCGPTNQHHVSGTVQFTPTPLDNMTRALVETSSSQISMPKTTNWHLPWDRAAQATFIIIVAD
jgi:hypothetical protein